MFMLFDWEKNQAIWQVTLDAPAGFCWRDELFYVVMARFSEVIALDGYGREWRRLSHRSFNDLHSIVPTKRGFLLTSTGTDSITEMDRHGMIIYEWCALDHGYQLSQTHSIRKLDRSLDQRYVFYPTPDHTTHVNSACFADPEEEVILATLFHQGTIIAIERPSGLAHTLVRGLNHPHDLRPFPGRGWLVSDTSNNRTLVLDERWHVTQEITLGFDWVQSSVPLADGSIIIADANNARLVRVYLDSQRPHEVRTFPPDWRIFFVDEVPFTYKDFFQHPIVSPPL